MNTNPLSSIKTLIYPYQLAQKKSKNLQESYFAVKPVTYDNPMYCSPLYFGAQKKQTQKKLTMDPNFLLVLNPQGALGENVLKYMNKEGTSSFGGQLTWVQGFSKAAATIPIAEVPIDLPRRHEKEIVGDKKFRVDIASQQIIDDARFGTDFKKQKERLENATIVRFPMRSKKYIDKEDMENGQNVYYTKVIDWGKDVANHYIREGVVPGMIMGGYWDSYIGYSNMNEQFKRNGLRQPKVIMVPHSLGYKKLKNILKDQNLNSKKEVMECAKELMDNPKYEFPLRIMTERLMFADPNTIGGFSSKMEINEQLMTGPYILSSKLKIDNKKVYVPIVTPLSQKSINAGIDIPLFTLEKTGSLTMNKDKKIREENVAKMLEERIKEDINPDRKNKDLVLAIGRLDPDKNFHGLINAFDPDISDRGKELQSKANLLFLVHTKPEYGNVNIIKIMQQYLNQNPDLKKKGSFNFAHNKPDNLPEEIKDFKGSNLAQLHRLAKMLDNKKFKGKWTAISVPDRRDYAAVQRYLGRESGDKDNNRKTVGGVYSISESYGLAPFETCIAGIPVVSSLTVGASKELAKHRAEGFQPTRPNELADALVKTLNDKTYMERRKNLMDFAKTKNWKKAATKYLKQIRYIDNKYLKEPQMPVITEKNIPSLKKEGRRLIIRALEEDNDFKDLPDV